MKRALSLIIVLAMVLCMIPFSAFAADWNVSTDFVDGVIVLEGSDEQSYLWTATEDGTLEIHAEPVLPETAEGEEAPAVAAPYIKVDGALYSEAIAVVAGESYEITFGDEAMIGGEVTVYTVFKGLPGTETNPYEMYNPATGMGDGNNVTVAIEPGASVYYTLYYYANTIVKISGEGVKVVKLGIENETIDGSEAGFAEFAFTGFDRNVTIKITNKAETAQTYTIDSIVPVGTMDNPEVVEAGEYQAELAAGNQGYYYTYIAEGNGTVNVNVYAQDAEGNTLGTMLAVNNLTSYIYGDQTTDGAWSVEVSEGDEISIMVATFNAEDRWNAPAGTVTTVIAFSEAEPEPEVGIDWGSVLGGETSKTNETDADILYTYTVEQDGVMYRSDYGFNFFVTAGETINITLCAGETVELYYASPVAKIGETEYYAFDEAVASAVAGDTIVLLADVVSEWDGIFLKPGINLNLGEYTLTAPYVIAFGDVTGVVGSASIVADEVKLDNVTIADVEYEWVAAEGVYGLVEYKAPVVGTEEPIVAEFNGEQMGLSAAITAAAAVATADAPATVTLISDATVDYNVVIEPNVILNIGKYTLTAPNVIGLNGSMINAAHGAKLDAHGKIVVPTKNNMALSNTVHAGAQANSYLLPVWNESYYLFTQVRSRTDKTSMSDTYVIIQLRHYWDDAAVKTLLSDGIIDDNALKVTIAASWLYGDMTVNQTYYLVGGAASAVKGSSYGGNSDTAGLTNYTIQGQIVSDCGAIVYWTNHTIN